jgi:hypothetical protein
MNSCDFKEFFVFGDFEVENGILGLERPGFVKFKKSMNNFLIFLIFFCVFVVVHWH